MREEGYIVTASQCITKMDNLKKSFKKCCDHNRQTGNTPKTIEHYDVSMYNRYMIIVISSTLFTYVYCSFRYYVNYSLKHHGFNLYPLLDLANLLGITWIKNRQPQVIIIFFI